MLQRRKSEVFQLCGSLQIACCSCSKSNSSIFWGMVMFIIFYGMVMFIILYKMVMFIILYGMVMFKILQGMVMFKLSIKMIETIAMARIFSIGITAISSQSETIELLIITYFFHSLIVFKITSRWLALMNSSYNDLVVVDDDDPNSIGCWYGGSRRQRQ